MTTIELKDKYSTLVEFCSLKVGDWFKDQAGDLAVKIYDAVLKEPFEGSVDFVNAVYISGLLVKYLPGEKVAKINNLDITLS